MLSQVAMFCVTEKGKSAGLFHDPQLDFQDLFFRVKNFYNVSSSCRAAKYTFHLFTSPLCPPSAAPSLVHEMYVAEKGGLEAVPADGVTLGEVLIKGAGVYLAAPLSSTRAHTKAPESDNISIKKKKLSL